MKNVCVVALVALGFAGVAVAQSSPVYPGGDIDFMPGITQSVVGDFDRNGVADVVALVLSEGVVSSQVAVGRGNGQFTVLPPRTVGAGQLGEFVAADVNGDGALDLVGLIGPVQPTLTVLFGDGAIDFELGPTVDLSVSGVAATKLVLKDVDVDGMLDVVLASGDKVFLLRGLGGGLFGPIEVVYASMSSTPLTALDTGDFDGDGVPDLVIADEVAANVLMLGGLGGGAFALADQRAVSKPASFAIDDLDADGDLDIAVASLTPGATVVFLGQGDLTFGAPVPVNTTQPTGVIVAGDYDNDGTVDLVASNPTALVVNFMRGQGGGQFATFKNDFVSARVDDIAPVRLNGDLATDWVITSSASRVSFALGRPNQISLFPLFANDGVHNTTNLIVADMNGDGADDRLYIRTNHGVFVGLWEGDGYSNQIYLGEVAEDIAGLAVGDVDGDGHLDVVTAERLASTVYVYKGGGDGTFSPATVLALGHPGATRGLAAGDLDADGDDEIIYAVEDPLSANDALFVLEADGAGNLGLVDTLSDLGIEGEVRELNLHDVDHDGALDLFARFKSGQIEVRLGVLGTTQFMPVSIVPAPAGDVPNAFFLGRFEDIDGDVVDDLVFLQANAIRAYSGRSDGTGGVTFSFVQELTFSDYFGSSGAVIERDGDGINELVLLSTTDQTLFVLRRSATPQMPLLFEVVERLPVGARELGVGRVNDDDFDDIVTLNSNSTSVVFHQPLLPWDALGGATAPLGEGLPTLGAAGDPSPGSPVRLEYSGGLPGVQSILAVGFGALSPPFPLQGGFVVPSLDILIPLPLTDGLGDLGLDVTWTDFPPGIRLWTQVWQIAGPDTHASNTLTVESR